MIREPNIIEHLPLFMQEYREIKEIMTAENPEFKLVIDESEVIKNNQFIVSCDSDGIKRFEKILGISATEQEPLQSRIARVLMRWNDTVPYTFEAFIEKLKTICGEDYTVTEKFKEYKIEIETHLDQYGEVDELEYLLQYIMPSNIEVVSKNNWYFNMVGKLGIAAGLIGSKRLPLKKPPERGGLFLCVRKFGVQGKLKIVERPAFLRTLLTEIHNFLQDAFQHIILCLCIREGIVDLK